MEPITGTRIGSILWWITEHWAENDIDLDKAWPKTQSRWSAADHPLIRYLASCS